LYFLSNCAFIISLTVCKASTLCLAHGRTVIGALQIFNDEDDDGTIETSTNTRVKPLTSQTFNLSSSLTLTLAKLPSNTQL